LTREETDEFDFFIPGLPTESRNCWESIDAFNDYLTKKSQVPEPHYGYFDKDISVCRFFNDKRGEGILSDIMAKNAETGMGNVRIPNTHIQLINYSYCPSCGKIYTQQMLKDYYNRPVVRSGNNLRYTLRKETRVVCSDCGMIFLPTLVIVDGSPKNSVQYLCRMQVVDAIETYMEKTYQEKVLTKNKKNIRYRKDGMVACANDLIISNLEEKQTLIVNFIQYTPAPLILNFIEQTNIEKDDVVFDNWQNKPTKENEELMLRVYP
jgi:hypothetical protein